MDFDVADSVRRDIKVLMTKTHYTVYGIYDFAAYSRTVKLKSVNWMKSNIYYHDIKHETGLP